MAEDKDNRVSALPAEGNESDDEESIISPGQSEQSGPVHVSRNLLGLLTSPESAAEPELEAERRHDLNVVIHNMLVAGLAASTIAIFIGLFLSAIWHHPLPAKVSGFQQIAGEMKKGSPSGFLDLGILLLIATPILRVVGSLVEFISKRDWRYAVITSMVLLILAVSMFVGGG